MHGLVLTQAGECFKISAVPDGSSGHSRRQPDIKTRRVSLNHALAAELAPVIKTLASQDTTVVANRPGPQLNAA